MDWKAKLRSLNLPTDAGRLLPILLLWLKWCLEDCHEFKIEDIWLIFCMYIPYYWAKLKITPMPYLQKQKSFTCGTNVSYFASMIEVNFTRLWNLAVCSSCLTKYFWKSHQKVYSPLNNASFGTFWVQIGILFETLWVSEGSMPYW